MVEFTAKVAAATTFEEMQSVINESVSEIGLMEFMRLDHGAVLASLNFSRYYLCDSGRR
jgi:hypothetical protein